MYTATNTDMLHVMPSIAHAQLTLKYIFKNISTHKESNGLEPDPHIKQVSRDNINPHRSSLVFVAQCGISYLPHIALEQKLPQRTHN